MKKLLLASLALGGLALSAQSVQAQNTSTAVSEDEARCFVTGVCKIGAEKKFSLTNISSAKQEGASQKAGTPAPAKAAARRTAAPRTATRSASAGATASHATRQSLNMRLNFEFGSAQLTQGAMAQADIFAKVLGESNDGHFLIEGHTDSIGSRAANLELSRQRAQSVVAYLVSHGVAASKLSAVGYGFDRPLDGVPRSDPANRRVEIVRN